MRKYKKKELINCIDTLQKANGKVLKVNRENRVDFLTQCQEMAIMVGTEIDKIEGEGIVTVSYLEQYCEELYLMSIAFDRAELIQAQKRINALLLQIKDSIRTDIADSPAEIVFLPYKASMWDALDSVYRVALQEENCHVVVMPVPYYNMNRKDDIVELHYEGNEFPADIPITDYREYSLEMMHPDIIFIHNPYDDCNHVTQLPKKYFSSELVKLTEKLVYIPYFVARGRKIAEIHCAMPAIHNAWRTFVQSEAIRESYIDGGADPKRIVALGSPKFDMVYRMQENPPAMPKEWENALTGRKVFLLNTHLNPIINEAERAIEKLQQIFLLFKEREDVALLWRPHPLSIETAKAMNPNILDSYMQLMERFKTLDNGVYDESADVHRAIALSDAYIGDESSLVTLYGMTGKPIYKLVTKSEDDSKAQEVKKMQFSHVVEEQGCLWGIADNKNGLFKIDPVTRKCELVALFEEENTNGIRMYRSLVAFDGKLFFVPRRANRIAEYCIDTEEMIYYDIPEDIRADYYKFSVCAVEQNKLILFAGHLRDIVCLDMADGTLGIRKWKKELIPKELLSDDVYRFNSGVEVDKVLYLPCMHSNICIALNMETFDLEIIRIPQLQRGFVDVSYMKQKLYFLCDNGDVYVYSSETGQSELFWQNVYGIPLENRAVYTDMLAEEDNLWLIGDKHTQMKNVRINMITKEYIQATEYPSEYMYMAEYPTGKKWIHYRMMTANNGYLYHEGLGDLNDYLDVIVNEEDGYRDLRQKYFCELQSNADGSCGEKIWKYVHPV